MEALAAPWQEAQDLFCVPRGCDHSASPRVTHRVMGLAKSSAWRALTSALWKSMPGFRGSGLFGSAPSTAMEPKRPQRPQRKSQTQENLVSCNFGNDA